MAKDYLKEYRNSIRKKYKIEKSHNSFLFNPSEANLRDLCKQLFKENQRIDDLNSFRLYFGFDFTIQTAYELNDSQNLNKFKPIGRFFKGESELRSIDGLNLAAMLVGFENRPFNKFSKMPLEEQDKNSKDTSSEQEIIDEKKNISSEQKDNNEDKKQPIIPILGIIDKPTEVSTPIKTQKTVWSKKNIKYASIGVVSLLIIIFGINHLTSEKECMAWMENHYKEIDCNAIIENKDFFIVPKDDKLIQNFKKIIPCDTTKYKKNGRACLWYGKSLDGNEYEFFTYHGVHPQSGKTLKEVTSTIMNKYERDPCK